MNELGDVRVAQGDLAGALQAYTESKNIAAKLAAADPGNAEWQRDLSISWDTLGTVREAQGDLPGPPGLRRKQEHGDRLAPPTPATPSGSATSRSAGTSSAACAGPRATCKAPFRPSPKARTSPTSSPPPTPPTPSGSSISLS